MIVGIGCDIVEIERIRNLMDKGLAYKLLTSNEAQIYENIQEPRKAEWHAGRFAAKEAVFKALPAKTIATISQIEIGYESETNDNDLMHEGKPVCINIPDYHIHISISHERNYAIGYAICEKDM